MFLVAQALHFEEGHHFGLVDLLGNCQLGDLLVDHQMACPLASNLQVCALENHLTACHLGAHLMVDPYCVSQQACLLEETLERGLLFQVYYFPHIWVFVNSLHKWEPRYHRAFQRQIERTHLDRLVSLFHTLVGGPLYTYLTWVVAFRFCRQDLLDPYMLVAFQTVAEVLTH